MRLPWMRSEYITPVSWSFTFVVSAASSLKSGDCAYLEAYSRKRQNPRDFSSVSARLDASLRTASV